MSDEPFDLKNLFGKFQDAQKLMQEKQKEASQKIVDVSVGGDMVKISINGLQEVQSVKISPEAVDPDNIEMLEDLMRAAVNEACRKSKTIFQDEMKSMMGNLNIPGLNLFGK